MGFQKELSGTVWLGLIVIIIGFNVVEFVQLNWEQFSGIELMIMEWLERSMFKLNKWYDKITKPNKNKVRKTTLTIDPGKQENLLNWWRIIIDIE